MDEPFGDATTDEVEDLLRSMTISEKVGQMTQADLASLKDKANIRKYVLGSVVSGGDSAPPENRPGLGRGLRGVPSKSGLEDPAGNPDPLRDRRRPRS